MTVSKLRHLNEGECADIYEIDSHTVLKLSKPGWSKDMLYQEYLNGKAIGSSIPAPRVYDFIEIEGRFGYTMDRLNDLTLLDLMWKHPWRVLSYAKKMAAIHAQIHSAKAPKELPTLTDKYSDFIYSKEGLSDDKKRMIIKALNRLSQESEDCICHGDFHPINILVDNDKYFVIDWVLASRGAAEADVAGTYLITSIYSSHMRGKNIFKNIAAAVGGKLIAKVYLKEYISLTKMDKRRILRWIPVRAATYVDVGLPKELDKKFQSILDKHYK